MKSLFNNWQFFLRVRSVRRRRAFGPALAVMMLTAALVTAIALAAGCGSQAEEPAPTTTVAAGATVSTEPAAALNAADLPMNEGTRLEFAANEPGTPAPVSFNLEGPWDFSSGPTGTTLSVDFISTGSAAAASYFPGAGIVAHYSWASSSAGDEYNFESLDNLSWKSYGVVGKGKLVKLSHPAEALIFPARVGSNWIDSFTRTDNGLEEQIVEVNQVVAHNTLTVPAGTFEAFLLKTQVTSTTAGSSTTTFDYIWLAPGVGRAAEIISQPNEKNEVFDQAFAFYRLRSF